MNAQSKPIKIKGPINDIKALKQALLDAEPKLKPGDPVAVKESLTDRSPMGQLEWFEVAVHFATSLAAHAAIEIIKSVVKKLNEGGAKLKISDK